MGQPCSFSYTAGATYTKTTCGAVMPVRSRIQKHNINWLKLHWRTNLSRKSLRVFTSTHHNSFLCSPENIHIHITAASRAVWYIARACAGDILYVPEGFSPRRTYFRITRRAHRARVLYDFSAREARLIWNISTRGSSIYYTFNHSK